jgi:hypothetical protein
MHTMRSLACLPHDQVAAAHVCMCALQRGTCAHREVREGAARVQARVVVQQLDVARLQVIVQPKFIAPGARMAQTQAWRLAQLPASHHKQRSNTRQQVC